MILVVKKFKIYAYHDSLQVLSTLNTFFIQETLLNFIVNIILNKF